MKLDPGIQELIAVGASARFDRSAAGLSAPACSAAPATGGGGVCCG